MDEKIKACLQRLLHSNMFIRIKETFILIVLSNFCCNFSPIFLKSISINPFSRLDRKYLYKYHKDILMIWEIKHYFYGNEVFLLCVFQASIYINGIFLASQNLSQAFPMLSVMVIISLKVHCKIKIRPIAR